MSTGITKCSCTPGYTCRGLCYSQNVSSNSETKKRAYSGKWAPIGKQISDHQKNRLYIPTIAQSITKWAYVDEKKCCSGNCILNLIRKYSFDKVIRAIHLARSDVYHTNANRAHEELRELLKFGRCAENGDVMTFFDHKNVFESETQRIKVSCVYLFLYYFPF